VDALVVPEIEKRAQAGQVDMERMLVDLYEAQVAFAAASSELDAFLEAGLVSELGPELYAREVARRREVVESAAAAYRAELDAQDRMAAADQSAMAQRREAARQLIENATLQKSRRGRWQPIAERVTVVWRDGRS
jgi:hypothetical protein